jgi:hypothetical protein
MTALLSHRDAASAVVKTPATGVRDTRQDKRKLIIIPKSPSFLFVILSTRLVFPVEMEGTNIPSSVEIVTEGEGVAQVLDTPPVAATTAPSVAASPLISPLNVAPVASQSAASTVPPAAQSASVAPAANPESPTQLDIDQLKNELKGSLDEEQGLITKQISLLTERQTIKTAIEKIKTDGQLAQLLEQKEMLEQLTSIATSI